MAAGHGSWASQLDISAGYLSWISQLVMAVGYGSWTSRWRAIERPGGCPVSSPREMDWIVVNRTRQIGDSKVRHILAYPLPSDGEILKLKLWINATLPLKTKSHFNASSSNQKNCAISKELSYG
jgi:hypothetical protein